jgi:hypothetical protein
MVHEPAMLSLDGSTCAAIRIVAGTVAKANLPTPVVTCRRGLDRLSHHGASIRRRDAGRADARSTVLPLLGVVPGVLFVVLIAACSFNPSAMPCKARCTSDLGCPSDWSCRSDGYCRPTHRDVR